ncbi:hypothetical protein [Vogesella sp. XCS3]|uniref:hypothetical protein n=1 Tax=Vogesella sp. XCS3 TaxID=2877939 RepID=UPI001D0BBA93|nr:hypothetical protein [Vogesella sp. XCS3]UDM18831.1 hypothetical protein LCH97_18335 [Vogesella sp. XCS3]
MSTNRIVVVSLPQEEVILGALKAQLQVIGDSYQASYHSDQTVTLISDAAQLFDCNLSLCDQGEGLVVVAAKERRERSSDELLASILCAYYPKTDDEQNPGLMMAKHAINEATDFQFDECIQHEVVMACCHAVGAYMFANFTLDDIDPGRSGDRYEECRKKIISFVVSTGLADLVLGRKAK